MTALRQSMLLNGAVWATTEANRRKPVYGASAYAFSGGALSSLVRAPACTPVWPTSRSAVRARRRLSRSSALVVMVSVILSGRALRIGSLAGSQFGLRVQV